MVEILKEELIDKLNLVYDLENISDRLCAAGNSKICIDFDLFPAHCLSELRESQNEPATVDAIILNLSDNHTLFVEFKDLNSVNEPIRWLTKVKLQQIYLKFNESFHMLATYLNQKSLMDYNGFYSHRKSIIVVYGAKDKKKFHKHFKGKLNRLRYLVENEFVVDCEKFINFIERKNLC